MRPVGGGCILVYEPSHQNSRPYLYDSSRPFLKRYELSLRDMASSGEEIISVQRGCNLPALNRCTSCCSLFHCPFCNSDFFKPSKKSKVQTHLKLHFSRAVVHEDYTIHRCGLGCVSQLHYHCVYCYSIKIRRDNFVAHLKGCKTASKLTTIPDVAPLTASTSTTIPDVAPLPSSTSTTIPDLPPLTASRSFIKSQPRNSPAFQHSC
ncbi:uncharacterized protein LOC125262681 [Megalobrama amblycephala]|uniref:uncharacterized protein LOC125262681 n=1 Tax=Megalobrama amblycephala TaxID=75352 RepID=UPI0020143F47|nr:uncharacterized protein LOC125262681 [Megalobrama amblycephala]